MQEMGPTAFRPYPRGLECLTTCKCHSKGNTFSSVISRPWVWVWSRSWTPTSCTVVRRSSTSANHKLTSQLAQLVEHCTGIAEVMGSNPVQAWIFPVLFSSLSAVHLYDFNIFTVIEEKNAYHVAQLTNVIIAHSAVSWAAWKRVLINLYICLCSGSTLS